MNCLEFSNRLGEISVGEHSHSGIDETLLAHAASCSTCNVRLENERLLTAALGVLAIDESKIQAPSYLRNDLLNAFESNATTTPVNVISFPRRSHWIRWALAAAASLIIAFALFSGRWFSKQVPIETAKNGSAEAPSLKSEEPRSVESGNPTVQPSNAPVVASVEKATFKSRVTVRTRHKTTTSITNSISTEVASSEVKSKFVPLTYLNDATAMESGIVVRVEIAREQLSTLGLPFDLDRAGDVIKADIVLGDDGVARAIRLVQ